MSIFLFFYSFCTTLLLIIGLPFILILVASKKKYQTRIWQRAGFCQKPLPLAGTEKTIWVHALSVGEFTSILPLLEGIKDRYPQHRLVLTLTTRSGQTLAEEKAGHFVDALLPAPFDHPWIIRRYMRRIQPSLFILTETDFWPGWLFCLKKNNIPVLLVNGRISKKSLRSYTRFSFFFTPLFRCFTLLAVQSQLDAARFAALGIRPEKIHHVGNLKLHIQEQNKTGPAISREILHIAPEQQVLVCGSTHPGEEAILLQAYKNLKQRFPALLLLLAPRDIGRADAIEEISRNLGLTSRKRTHSQGQEGEKKGCQADVFILDTIGELSLVYGLAHISFVGGSLVPFGGHNPLEPAQWGIPVLFGPYMDDFVAIGQELLACGGAVQLAEKDFSLENTIRAVEKQVQHLLTSPDKLQNMGEAALSYMQEHQNVLPRHLETIDTLLQPSSPHGR